MSSAFPNQTEMRDAKIVALADAAVRVFGSRENAERWLNNPALALDGLKPIDLLKTPQGFKRVADVIGRLEYGVYT